MIEIYLIWFIGFFVSRLFIFHCFCDSKDHTLENNINALLWFYSIPKMLICYYWKTRKKENLRKWIEINKPNHPILNKPIYDLDEAIKLYEDAKNKIIKKKEEVKNHEN